MKSLAITMARRAARWLAAAAAAASLAGPAQAQVPVTVTSDFPATINHIETIAKWADQLRGMTQQLEQMRQVYSTLEGTRNLGSILNSDLQQQYLPQNYAAAAKSLISGGGGEFAGISGSLADIVKANQLRTCTELNTNIASRNACTAQWQQLALQKQVGDMGYQKAAENIRNLQAFVGSINASTDVKAINEVQARIQVETVRMQNEQVKLATIQAMQDADRRMKQQSAIDTFNSGLVRGSAGGIRF